MNHEYAYEYPRKILILLNVSLMKIILSSLLSTLFLIADGAHKIMDVGEYSEEDLKTFNVN